MKNLVPYKIFEAQIKADDKPHKYKIGDIVTIRDNNTNRRNFMLKDKLKYIYTIMELKYENVTIFTGPTHSIKKNAYLIKSTNDQRTVRESEIRPLKPIEIEQRKIEMETDKYNL